MCSHSFDWEKSETWMPAGWGLGKGSLPAMHHSRLLTVSHGAARGEPFLRPAVKRAFVLLRWRPYDPSKSSGPPSGWALLCEIGHRLTHTFSS